MTSHTKTYYGTPGATFISDPALAYVFVRLVSRSTRVAEELDGIPPQGSSGYYYEASSGTVYFDPLNPFYGTGVPGRINRNNLEKIIISYDTI